MAGHGGGAWKVAYADFVTAMMAFFLVMWITAQGEDVKQAVAGYFQDPWGTSSANSAPSFQVPGELHGDSPGAGIVPGRIPNRKPSSAPPADVKKGDPPPLWAQQHDIHYLSNTDRTLPALIVQFDEESAKLSPEARRQLTELLPALAGKANMIEIRAHSTRRPLSESSGFRDHWQLCYARSMATMQFLIDHGIEADRIRLSQAASNEPLTVRYETTLQRANNRVELFLLDTVATESPGTQASAAADGAGSGSAVNMSKGN